jgi:hypothetical protein
MPSGDPVWPEYWPLEELEKVKASITVRNWNAQYMQDPVAEEGAILKREWWKPWKKPLPQLAHVIQSYDTAFSKKKPQTILLLLPGEYFIQMKLLQLLFY